MDRTELIHQIQAALSETLEKPVEGLSEEVRLFDDMHLDSTSVLEVLMTLEDSVGVEVDPEELQMDDFATVGSFADYLTRQSPAVG